MEKPALRGLVLSVAIVALVGGCKDDDQGRRGDPLAQCCNPLAEPGVGDNPTCVEGATCCADGTWACNEGDGSSTCAGQGAVCQPDNTGW